MRDRGGEGDAEAGDVVTKNLAELIARDLADEAGTAAGRGKARDRIRLRSAACLPRLAHPTVKAGRLGRVDQPHRALGETLRFEEGIVGGGDHVDNGVADGEDVQAGFGEAGFGHGRSAPSEMSRVPSLGDARDQPAVDAWRWLGESGCYVRRSAARHRPAR